MKTEIREFLNQYPQYDSPNYEVKSHETCRYNGDYEIIVYDVVNGEIEYNCCYWCKLWNNEAETTYQYELQKEINTMRIRVDIDSYIEKTIHYDYDERDYHVIEEHDFSKYLYVDYPRLEKNVVEMFRQENDKKIREEIAKKILSGEIDIMYYCSDTDSWDAPISQIDKIYKV